MPQNTKQRPKFTKRTTIQPTGARKGHSISQCLLGCDRCERPGRIIYYCNKVVINCECFDALSGVFISRNFTLRRPSRGVRGQGVNRRTTSRPRRFVAHEKPWETTATRSITWFDKNCVDSLVHFYFGLGGHSAAPHTPSNANVPRREETNKKNHGSTSAA